MLAQAAPHRTPHMGAAHRGGARRDIRGARPPVRRDDPQGARHGVRPAVPRPRLGARHRPGRLRRGGLLRDGRAQAPRLLRPVLPLLQRRRRAGLRLGERRVRLPGPEEHIRVRLRRPHPHRLRQRHRRRAPRLRKGQHHRDLLGLRRPLRIRLPLLQPRLGAREVQRRAQGGLHTRQPVRAPAARHLPRVLQRPPHGPVHGAQRGEGPLEEGRARAAAVRGGLLRDVGAAREAVPRGPVGAGQGQQAGQVQLRRAALLLERPGACGPGADLGPRRDDGGGLHAGRRLRVLPREGLRRRADRHRRPRQPAGAARRQVRRVELCQDFGHKTPLPR